MNEVKNKAMVTKYAEKVKIYNHYTNYKGRLFVKTLCDLFNDAAEVQTELYKVDVDTLNAQGFTWMLHRLHILLHKMPLKEEIVTIETWPSGIDRLFALRDYRMFREDGEELVRATSEWMYIDMKRRRPLRLPENVIAMSTEHNIPKLVLAPLLDEKEFGGERQGIRHFTATFDNIDFNGIIWDYDIPEIVKALKENGISEFTISSTFSSLIETLAAFEKEGIRMAGLTEVNATYSDWKIGKKARIPAIRMTL